MAVPMISKPNLGGWLIRTRPAKDWKTDLKVRQKRISQMNFLFYQFLTSILNVLNLSIESAKMKSRVKLSYQNREL